jgi:ferredoxin-NADP reductase
MTLSVHAGDVLHVLGPSGSFVAEKTARPRHLVLIAGGSGITPIASLIETTLRTEPSTRATLVYGNRSARDVIFQERLDALRAAHAERFAIDHVHEALDAGAIATCGRLDAATLASRLDALGVHDGADVIYFVCGPTPMMDAAREALVARGVTPTRIREERFSSPESRRTREGSRMPQEIRVRAGSRALVAVATPGSTVLEAGLEAGAPMPFSCAMGGCGACKVRLIEGQIEMDEPNCLTEEERTAGYVLTCVGHALTRATIELPSAGTEAS